ncbi:SDR family oxidoreductase [Pseudomonas sp. BN414]|uniref:SDR family NAD(P)-dependent oxidoreductase n=1 Tax=Pseudomonas sp. BN414 TaxID=2567888 RepID=UPI0024545DC0|nr:SDR family oxidoreductase [Pseudomonas sp. BN414]MDH4566330.1 SDR family oxidoreductase [Pseudomonas sp. BN414]
MNSRTHQGTALVTGASSGIGAVYADRLARAGYDLILVARRAEKLRELARTITTRSGRSVETIAADLTDADDLARVEGVLRSDASITLLVNNAGVGATGPLLQSNVADMEQMIELNVNVLTRLAYAAAPAFVARGTGTIINIASIVALAPELLNGVYGGSKAYVLAFSQSLQHELADKGVRVQVVLPGATETDFWNVAGLPVSHLPPEIVMPVDALVDAALAGLAQGEIVTIPALAELDDWTTLENARKALSPQLSRSAPAPRYLDAGSMADD